MILTILHCATQGGINLIGKDGQVKQMIIIHPEQFVTSISTHRVSGFSEMVGTCKYVRK